MGAWGGRWRKWEEGREWELRLVYNKMKREFLFKTKLKKINLKKTKASTGPCLTKEIKNCFRLASCLNFPVAGVGGTV